MKTKTIKLSFIAVTVIALFTGCDSSTSSSTVTDITDGASLTLISHTSQTECFNSNGDTVICTGSGQDGEYLNIVRGYNFARSVRSIN